MKRTLTIIAMSFIMVCMAACGGSNQSKAFKQSEKVLKNVLEQVNKATTCDEIDMAAFGIIGLLGIDGVENLTEAEQQELSKYTDEIDKVTAEKKAALGCKDDSFDSLFDEEMPLDEPVEGEEE